MHWGRTGEIDKSGEMACWSGKLSESSTPLRAATNLPQLPGPHLRPSQGRSRTEVHNPGPWLPDTSAPNPLPRPCPTTVRSTGPGVRSPGTSAPPPAWVQECAGTRRGDPRWPRALRNLTSQPRYTGGHCAARSGAGLPAPAQNVKLRRPEVPPSNGVMRRGAARRGG